jgi:electron-transferring-flavoprotein dehydrogenase
MEFDVVIVGAGPAGLATAIRLHQLASAAEQELEICVLEKASEVGAHTLSGAVIETKALDELLPNWQEMGAPISVEAQDDQFLWLTEEYSYRLPTPPQMHNEGNYIVRLGHVVSWLGEQAEALGINIFPGFAASEVLYHPDGSVKGVATGDMGIGKDGAKTDNYTPGMELHAKQTIFAEGCRGSLTKELMERFDLRKDAQVQTYGIGIKEVWEVKSSVHKAGTIVHTVGWPLKTDTYGGSFLYHLDDNKIAVGFVIGLDYSNPYLSPFNEFQRFKTHPTIRKYFEGGKRISYGARAISEGGLQSVPALSFHGGVLVGDGAGFLNVPKIKGTHTAMKSGMCAAEAVFDMLQENSTAETSEGLIATSYQQKIEDSWIWPELSKVRNIRPAFTKGLWAGIAYSALDTYVLRGKAPWTFSHHADNEQLKPAVDSTPIDYPKPDGELTFDRLSSVFLSDTAHEENQPAHLTLIDSAVPISHNLALYDAPEQRYCPAGVYEIITTNEETGEKALQINAQNCVHCKTCDIKDPTQNIKWVVPEGGGGPNYNGM